MDSFSRFRKDTGVGQIIDSSLRSFPEREAIVFGDWRLRYSELGSLIYKTARFLMSLGVKKGDSVAIISRNCPEYIIAEMAILKLGAVVVKFNWRLTPEEMDELLERNRVACAFYKAEDPLWGRELEERTAGRLRLVRLEPVQGRSVLYTLLDGFSDEPIETRVEPDAPAYHMHTSGTTGRCKCVVYSTQRYLDQLESMLRVLEFPEGQVYQFISQLFHSACAGAFLTLTTGGTLILMQQFNVKEYVESLVREKVNAIGVIPLVLQSILDATEGGGYDLSNLHVINYSTCPISPELLSKALRRLDCRFYQSYGMTEMGSTVTALLPEDHFAGDGACLRSVGRPLPGAQVQIQREDGSLCRPGETGEICLRGHGMMLEYYGQEAATAEAFRGGWYHSKDVGYLDGGGYLYLRGRMDSLIISGGENIYPEEVSNVLLKMPQILETAVFGVPDEKWGEHVKACVVPRPGCGVTEQDIKDFCRANMPAFRIPKEIEFMTELPKNATGKLLLDKLKHEA